MANAPAIRAKPGTDVRRLSGESFRDPLCLKGAENGRGEKEIRSFFTCNSRATELLPPGHREEGPLRVGTDNAADPVFYL
jgi:hypothetical protein